MYPEPLDRNKTDLTHRMTAVAMIYLENRGFRPVETEVAIAGFGIADVAGFCYPTPTETKKLRLANQDRFGTKELSYSEIGFWYGPLLTAAIEVKTSRSDFVKDKLKFTRPHPAHLCYLAFPKGLLAESDIPMGWHGLEADSTGQQLRRKFWTSPSVHPQHPGAIADFIAALAVRTDYRTRFARHRMVMKMYRAGQANF